MKKLYIILITGFCLITANVIAQNTFPLNGSAGIGTTTPDASSILELKSTTKGFLAPRMTKAQRNAIASPAQGLMIYQTNSTPGFYYYNGSGWVAIKAPATTYTAGQGISIVNGVITNIGDANASDDITTNTAASGDLAGTYPSPLVAKLQGTPLYPVAPATGQVLKYNGSYWLPSADDNTTYTAGNGLSLSGNVFTNTAPDQTVTLTGNGATMVTGTYPNFTISSTDNNTTYTAGTGISITGTAINNTAPSPWDTSGTSILYNNGNVGIGASSPQSKLDVNGDINLNGIIKMNGISVFTQDIGAGNSFIGAYSGITNSGNLNTGNGYSALEFNTSGTQNTATGANALSINDIGSYNTANGYSALSNNSAGNENTANGVNALYSNYTGSGNVANGIRALLFNNNGSYNTADGYNALLSNIFGSYNTALGNGANVSGNNYSNTTVLGNNALGTASNQVRIGNSDVTSIGGYANWTNISDGRVKKNIKENVPGLAFINKLKPVTYNLNLDEADNIIQRPAMKDKDGKLMQPSKDELDSRSAKMKILYTGFIAQDVEKAAKSLNYNFSGVDAPKNDKDLYGLRYAEFVVPLVKAVQELSKQNDDKDTRISNLEKQNNDLQKQFADLKNLVVQIQQAQQKCSSGSSSSSQISQQIASVSSASLQQNIPNPFNQVTIINYTLPQTYSSAKIIVTDKQGKTLKEINLPAGGQGVSGSVKIDASTLASGAYQYSLYVNNKLIGTKQMLLQK